MLTQNHRTTATQNHVLTLLVLHLKAFKKGITWISVACIDVNFFVIFTDNVSDKRTTSDDMSAPSASIYELFNLLVKI
jgi:hypothetical protein